MYGQTLVVAPKKRKKHNHRHCAAEGKAIQKRKALDCFGRCLRNDEKETEITMTRGGVVYIMANKRNSTLYTGVTANLKRRVYEHKTKCNPESFTAKYDCSLLVYYQSFHSIEEAIVEEKRIKGGNRKNKLKLIETLNPEWKDLWDKIKEW